MDNAVNIGHTATIVSAVFQAVATVFVGARLFCRIKLLDKLYIDDWIILISLVRLLSGQTFCASVDFVTLFRFSSPMIAFKS